MAKVKTPIKPAKRGRPAISIEARENQMISLAVDLAEQQLRDGTASSQVITHYLKLGTTRELLERQLLEKEVELKEAKKKALGDQAELKELYADAIRAMRIYQGQDVEEYEED